MVSDETLDIVAEVFSNILLFLLIFGMSATVEYSDLVAQLKNKKAIVIGIAMQFLIMPFLGYVSLKTLGEERFDPSLGVILLVVTSSPGGSFSNWWCSLFNAELSLSVAMTAISTLMSIFMLPANLLFYSHAVYGRREDSILHKIDWGTIFVSLAIVIMAILTGIKASYTFKSNRFRLWANRFGSVSGIVLVCFSFMLSTFTEKKKEDDNSSKLWEQDWPFYLGVSLPCLLGLFLANVMSYRLSSPERVTLSVECCYQNAGIATSVAVAMFSDNQERAAAMNVPLLYGLVEAVALALYCLVAWKKGWTKAPADENLCTTLMSSYEVSVEASEDDLDSDDIEESKDGLTQLKPIKKKSFLGRLLNSNSLTAAEELKEMEILDSTPVCKKRGNSEDTVCSNVSAKTTSSTNSETSANLDAPPRKASFTEAEIMRIPSPVSSDEEQGRMRHRSSPFVTSRKSPNIDINHTF